MSKHTRTETEPVLVSLQTAAARWEVSVDFLRTLIAKGDLPCYRIGKGSRGLLRVAVSDLDSLLRRIPTAGGVL